MEIDAAGVSRVQSALDKLLSGSALDVGLWSSSSSDTKT